MQEVEALCSRVLMLHGGRLALDEELETIRQSNHLLLETSLNKEEVEAISKISGVEHIETLTIGGEVNKYRIRFSADVSPKELSALVAQAVADKKASLYLLHPELRDLETLFKEVNEGKFDDEGVQNAA
jgi:ABC-2 type transport system ATP-binding protein